jgi:hypothetical protein
MQTNNSHENQEIKKSPCSSLGSQTKVQTFFLEVKERIPDKA